MDPDPKHCFLYTCSAWEGWGTHKSVIDKESIEDRPPVIRGGEDYMVNRLERMFGEDRKIHRDEWPPWICIKPHFVCLINSWIVPAVLLFFGCKGIVSIRDIIDYYSIILKVNPRFKVWFIKFTHIYLMGALMFNFSSILYIYGYNSSIWCRARPLLQCT